MTKTESSGEVISKGLESLPYYLYTFHHKMSNLMKYDKKSRQHLMVNNAMTNGSKCFTAHGLVQRETMGRGAIHFGAASTFKGV